MARSLYVRNFLHVKLTLAPTIYYYLIASSFSVSEVDMSVASHGMKSVTDALGGEDGLALLVEAIRRAVEDRTADTVDYMVEDAGSMNAVPYIARDFVAIAIEGRLMALGFDASVGRQGKSPWKDLLAMKDGIRLTVAKVDAEGERPRSTPFKDSFNSNGQYRLDLVEDELVPSAPLDDRASAIVTYQTSARPGRPSALALASVGILLPGITEENDEYFSLNHLIRRSWTIEPAVVDMPVVTVKRGVERRASGDGR